MGAELLLWLHGDSFRHPRGARADLEGCCLRGAGSHGQGAGAAEAGVNLYHSQLYRSQSFAESAELAAEMEKAQLRENVPGNARKGS